MKRYKSLMAALVLTVLALGCEPDARYSNESPQAEIAVAEFNSFQTVDRVDVSTNPPGGLSPQEIPQFIVLTFDDAVTPYATDLYRKIMYSKHQNNCHIKATWYVSMSDGKGKPSNTDCGLVNGLIKGQHEIATHTYSHEGNPSEKDITDAVDHLVDVCGVQRESLKGFRAPYLKHDQNTFNHLQKLGFLYDSSITEHPLTAQKGANHIFPYTMHDGIKQDCSTSAGTCDPSQKIPGLWEIPMWALYNEDGTANDAMDYKGDVKALLDTNFKSHYNGNRAPIGIFLHASWLAKSNDETQNGGLTKGEVFSAWIDDVLSKHNDVYFVTNTELIEWMRNPKKAVDYTMTCEGQVPDCFAPEGIRCSHGSFSADTCSCVCNTPYCHDEIGSCTLSSLSQTCHDKKVDGGWGPWGEWSQCSAKCGDGIQVQTRLCDAPAPSGGGAQCVGESQMQRDCNLGECTGTPVDGGWTDWSDWSDCSQECGSGTQTSTRSCTAPAPENGGKNCTGSDTKTQACSNGPCTHKYYPDWTKSQCVNDGQQPPWQANLYVSGKECCHNHFAWNLQACLKSLGGAVQNTAPTAASGNVETAQDTASTMTLVAFDVDGDALTTIIVDEPENGQLSGSGDVRTYTPNKGFFGNDTFSFKVNDGKSDSGVATVSITVVKTVGPKPNTAPVALGGTVKTQQETAVAITLVASDADGDTLNYLLVDSPPNGGLEGSGNTRIYTPDPGFHGTDSFTFKVNDGKADSATVSVSIAVAKKVVTGAIGCWKGTYHTPELGNTRTCIEQASMDKCNAGMWGYYKGTKANCCEKHFSWVTGEPFCQQ